MSANATLLVLAAGMGSRYGGLKQLERFGPAGETIMDYSIYGALAAGLGRLVFVIRRDFEEAFRATIGKRYEGRVPVEYVFQAFDDLPSGFAPPSGRTKPWGTTHAIWCARRAIVGPFVSINADDFYGRSSMRAVAEHLARGAWSGPVPEYCMAGYRLLDTLSERSPAARAIGEVDQAGFLEWLAEHQKVERSGTTVTYVDDAGVTRPLGGDELVSMNIWGFTPEVFPQLERQLARFLTEEGLVRADSECLIPTVVGTLVRDEVARVRVLPTTDVWFGVTNPEDKATVTRTVHELVQRGEYPSPLWGGGRVGAGVDEA